MTRRRAWIAACLALAAIFGWLFYIRYWKWRACIEQALSSCITPAGDNLTAGGMLWGFIAVFWMAIAAFLAGRR